jgi:hypothetical protein
VAGGLRFVMSLRATGEGHISSIEFREGIIAPDGWLTIRSGFPLRHGPEVVPNPSYLKKRFIHKLHEMGFDNDCANAVMAALGDRFTRSDLNRSLGAVRHPAVNSAMS